VRVKSALNELLEFSLQVTSGFDICFVIGFYNFASTFVRRTYDCKNPPVRNVFCLESIIDCQFLSSQSNNNFN